MVIIYDVVTGQIRATIDHAMSYPADPLPGEAVLITAKELGGRAWQYRVDVKTRQVIPLSEEEVQALVTAQTEEEHMLHALQQERRARFEREVQDLRGEVERLKSMLRTQMG